MTDPSVTIWPSRYLRGWDGTPPGELEEPLVLCPPVPVREALAARYDDSDAHFWPGVVLGPGGAVEANAPRITKGCVEALRALGGDLRLTCAVVDLDCPKAHKSGDAASAKRSVSVILLIRRLGRTSESWSFLK